jgi:gamma-glutamylcyclotransferase (GGCT)/AIG2-like uncharacterized protein YtfP
MEHPEDASVSLFSYGTLQLETVQLATFGRRLEGKPDTLKGFALLPVRIEDAYVVATSGLDVHTTARRTDDPRDAISGTVFRITAEELQAADRYEVDDYVRISVRLASGTAAFVYVLKTSD